MSIIETELRKLIHPVLLWIMKQQQRHKMIILNCPPQMSGNAIYAINHSCRHDIPYAAQIIKRHSYVLVGKQRLNLIDRIAFFVNGVIYVDRKNKFDKAKAKNKMKEIILNEQNLCIFPEGTWNLTPSAPMLPLYWGIIEIAKDTKRPIVPIVLEYKRKECYVKWGEPIYVEKMDTKEDKIKKLSDEMASLRWNIWESFPINSRKELDMMEWKREKQRRLAEYPKLDYQYEKSCVRG